jgi:hypothetical protein
MASKDKVSRESKKPGKSLQEKRAAKHAKTDQQSATRAADAAMRKN